MTHASLDEYLRSLPTGDGFGDAYEIRASGSTRVVFQNVNGIPYLATNSKQSQIQDWLKSEQVGIALLAETNTHWPSLPEGHGWNDRMREVGKKGYFTSVANNRHQSRSGATSFFQQGGTAVSVLNEAAHTAKSSGCDPTGLGRWSFVRLRGKQFRPTAPSMDGLQDEPTEGPSQDLIVISAYRPNPPGDGESTVWAQHRLYFNERQHVQGTDGRKRQRRINPRTAFVTDLVTAIRQWRSEGCEIILGVDANEDLSSLGPTSFRYKLQQAGMTEAILQRHGPKTVATYQRNTKNQPIDGIFTSSGVSVLLGGYYGFDEFFDCDHRGLWIDINLHETLGGYSPQKSSFKARKLNLNDSSAVRRYLRYTHQAYREYDIQARIKKIDRRLRLNGGIFTPSLLRKYNCLHQQMYTIRRKAEDQCRKLSMGKVPWSPQMQAFWDRLSLWKILIKGRLKCRVSSRKVRRLMKKTGRPEAWKKSTTDLQECLKLERQAYKEAKRTSAVKWRRDYISVQVKVSKKKKWRSRQARERFLRLRRMKQREEARRRRRAQGKGSRGGLRAIQVEHTTASGQKITRTIKDRKLVEEGCMNENRARYDQTRAPHATPPMQEPLYSSFTGATAESNSKALLEGRYHIPDELDPSTQAFLGQCRFAPTHAEVPVEITTEDHVAYWSKNPENKGSEPHGLHNGHFKAGIQSATIAECDALFRNIPLSTGMVPLNWRNLMNFAIEKKAGDLRLEKMRTIQLMNSEYQANTKKLGRTAMYNAEMNQLIPSGQCGSRARHQAIDLAWSKRMVWDLLILQRRSAGWISNDAKSCFDRVVHWIAILALLRFGLTWRALTMMFNTLATSKHRVRTGFGDSTAVFQPPSDVPFQGCGQGNGAGPAIWVAISSILITMMDAAGYGFECLTTLESKLVTAQCFCFVDDTDVIEASSTVDQSGESIFPSVQQAATLWARGIRATGGAINPDKSFWWLIDFEWNSSQGRWTFRTKKQMEPELELQIPGLTGELEALRRLDPNEAEKTLGVMMAPLENEAAQEQYYRDIATKWAENLRPGTLHKYDVIPLIKTTVMKSLEYPMPLSTLSESTWVSIISPILQVCLPKAGVCRNFPRAAVLAPMKLQGLDIPHPFGLQICHHLTVLLKHSANNTSAGEYLDANLQAHQLETGTSYGLLQQDYSNTAILSSDTWLKRVWHELEALDTYVAFDSPALDLHCEGDSLLMELFMDAAVDQDVLLWLNWCRLYLRVSTVSDLLTADGSHIRNSVWHGQRDDTFRSTYHWPRTVRPTTRHWETWRQVLSSTLLLSHGPSHPLRSPLGRWSDSPDRWNWLFSPTTGFLFHREGPSWKSFTRKATFAYSRQFDPTTYSWWKGDLPLDVQRTTVQWVGTSVLVTGQGMPVGQQPSNQPSLLRAWQQAYDQSTDFYGWVPDDIEILGSEEELVDALLAGRLRVISDGSYKDQVGSASTLITTKNGSAKIIVKCQTPGLPQNQSAYRSELIGLLCGIMTVDWLLQQWAPQLPAKQKPRVRIACDGLSALQNTFHDYLVVPTQKQFDLVSALRNAVHNSAAKWRPMHVYGHLDKSIPHHLLTWWEKRNIDVDEWAVAYRKLLFREGDIIAPNPRFFSEPAAIFIGDVKQARLDPILIQELVSLPALRDRWRRTNQISAAAEAEIDWKLLGRAMHSLQAGIQRWTTKHTVGMCGVGKFMELWGKEDTAACPICGEFEDHLHVPRCPSSLASLEWEHRVDELSAWMYVQRTSPYISQAILSLLREVRSAPPLDLHCFPHWMHSAIRSQRLIGPQGLLEGRLSTQWTSIQAEYFQEIGSRQSAPLWTSRLIQQLILIGFYMWEHRNSVKHSDDNVLLQRRSRIVDEGIRSQFEMGTTDLPPEIRPMLRHGIARTLRKSLIARETWLKVVRSERTAVRRALAPRRRLLRNFLSTPSAPS